MEIKQQLNLKRGELSKTMDSIELALERIEEHKKKYALKVGCKWAKWWSEEGFGG